MGADAAGGAGEAPPVVSVMTVLETYKFQMYLISRLCAMSGKASSYELACERLEKIETLAVLILKWHQSLEASGLVDIQVT